MDVSFHAELGGGTQKADIQKLLCHFLSPTGYRLAAEGRLVGSVWSWSLGPPLSPAVYMHSGHLVQQTQVLDTWISAAPEDLDLCETPELTLAWT